LYLPVTRFAVSPGENIAYTCIHSQHEGS